MCYCMDDNTLRSWERSRCLLESNLPTSVFPHEACLVYLHEGLAGQSNWYITVTVEQLSRYSYALSSHIHTWWSTSKEYHCGRILRYGHCRFGNWRILSRILGVLLDARSAFYEARVKAGTSRSFSGRASQIGDKCSLRAFERRRELEYSRLTRWSEDPYIRRIPLWLPHPMLTMWIHHPQLSTQILTAQQIHSTVSMRSKLICMMFFFSLKTTTCSWQDFTARSISTVRFLALVL